MPVATQILSPALASRLAAFDSAALGPHAAALLSELRQAASGGMPLAVTVLAATLVDVVANEEAGPAGFIDGIDFAYAGNKAALGWLRGRRNALLHHEGPTDGLMGEAIAADWHRRDAERAVAA
ncbi:MAG: hypothetical protein VXY51_02435, partial [Pseudomonadota bacterium]|nr:hypothetical protein [Pseudomonadota bacterium]